MAEAPSPSRRPRVAVVMSVYNPDPAYLETQVLPERMRIEQFPGHRFIKALKKLFNPHPFRQNLGDEVGCRAMFLLGKL